MYDNDIEDTYDMTSKKTTSGIFALGLQMHRKPIFKKI